MSYENLEVVLVEWLDAASIDEWTSRDEINPGLAKIVSLGIKIAEGGGVITLALNLDVENDNVSCRIDIPKNCIVRRKKLCLLKDLKLKTTQ